MPQSKRPLRQVLGGVQGMVQGKARDGGADADPRGGGRQRGGSHLQRADRAVHPGVVLGQPGLVEAQLFEPAPLLQLVVDHLAVAHPVRK